MKFLYLDDSGKIHANDPAKFFVLAGFSVDEDHWHTVVRRVNGAKSQYFPDHGKPYEWEIKSTSFLTPNAWKRDERRRLCFDVTDILKRSRCHVYAVSLEKSRANDALDQAKFFPLAFQRLVAKFHHEVTEAHDTGSVVCDWSTHQTDHLICMSVTSMVITHNLEALRGGVSYGSSAALVPLQVADLISGTPRRSLEGQHHLDELADRFRALRYSVEGGHDHLGFPINSILKMI